MVALQGEKESLTSRVGDLEGEVKKLRRELEEEMEKTAGVTGEVGRKCVGVCVCVCGGGRGGGGNNCKGIIMPYTSIRILNLQPS